MNMKKITNILTVVLLLLIVAQFALTFLPYFENMEIKKVEQTTFTLEEYMWVYCDEMTETLEDTIDGYTVNEYCVPLIGIFLFALVALLFNIFSQKRGLFTQVFTVVWGAATPILWMTCPMLPYGNTGIQTAEIIISVVGLVVAIARVVTWLIAWQQKRKALLAA